MSEFAGATTPAGVAAARFLTARNHRYFLGALPHAAALRAVGACCVLCFSSLPSLAQSPVGIAAAPLSPEQVIQEGIRRQEERSRDQQKALEPKADELTPAIGKDVKIVAFPQEATCFIVNDVSLVGKDSVRFSWLPDAAMPYLRRCVGVKGLSFVARELDITAGTGASPASVRASGTVVASNSQLFTLNRSPTGPLVETDPAFTGYHVGSQNGVTVNGSFSKSNGKADGSDTSWTNTHVNAGNTVTIQSGGDKMLSAMAIATLGLSKLGDPRNDKTPHKVIKEYEGGQDLIFRASTNTYSGNVTSRCGPLRIKFRPEAGKRYRMDLIREARMCLLNLMEITEDARRAIPAHTRWRCTASLLGFDGNNVVGLQEFEAR